MEGIASPRTTALPETGLFSAASAGTSASFAVDVFCVTSGGASPSASRYPSRPFTGITAPSGTTGCNFPEVVASS